MKMRRIIALAGAVVFLLSGCGNTQTANKDSVKVVNDGSLKITEEPTELTLFYINSTDSYLEELPVWEKVAELTNVKLKTVNSKSISDPVTAFNTLMASGELPDLVAYGEGKENFSKFGMEGAFIPLEDLIENKTTYLKKEFEKTDVRNFTTAADGHIYYIPSMNPPTVSKGWLIRQDWLDKLSLPSPTSVEEYYNTLVAFRDGDPNGNGKADEVPYFSRFGTVDDLVYLWDATLDWGLDENGKVFYGPAQEEYKTAYTNIAKWYAENLIDKEIYTRGAKSRDKLLGDNVGGSTHDWFGSTAQFNDMLKENVPGMNIQAIAPPNGKEYTRREEVLIQGVAVSAMSDKQEVAIRFLDFLFSEEGSRLMNFGLEGEHYDMKDGKPYFQDWVIHGDKTAINILQEAGSCTSMPYRQDFWYEEQWLNDSAKKGVNLYIENDYLQPLFPILSYTVEEKTRLNEIMIQIQTLVKENTQKWVFGSESIEAGYDSYISQMKNMGLEEAVAIQQAAYDRYKSNK